MGKGDHFPAEWHSFTDDQTGVEIRQLTNYKGHSHHLYFTNPGWYDGGRRLLVQDGLQLLLRRSGESQDEEHRRWLHQREPPDDRELGAAQAEQWLADGLHLEHRGVLVQH